MLNILEIINNKDKNYYKNLARKHVIRWYILFILLSLNIIILFIPSYIKVFISLDLSDILYAILSFFYILFFFWLPFLGALYLGIRLFKYRGDDSFKLYFKSLLILFLFLPFLYLPFITFWRNIEFLLEGPLIICLIYIIFSSVFFSISYTLINKTETKTIFYNKVYYSILGVILIGSIYYSGSYIYNKLDLENITDEYEYYYSECVPDENPGLSDFVNKIYREGSNIILKAKISMNCGVDTQKGVVNIRDGKIIMDVQGNYPSMTLCICNFNSSFKVKNPVKKDYEISVNVDKSEIDNFTFLKNGEIKDKCTNNSNYDCYFPKGKEEKRKKATEYPFEITYENREFSEIAKKNPKFEEYIYNYEYKTDFAYYRNYKYKLKLEAGGIRVYTNGSQYTLHGSNGRTYEEAIINYINYIDNEIGIGSYTYELKKQFPNIDILIAFKNGKTIYFTYNNELIEYSGGQELNFRNKWEHSFYFDNNNDILSITEKELINRIIISDKLYKYIEKNNYDVIGDVKITDNNTATFGIYIYPENNNDKLLIHNKEVIIKEKSEVKDISVNIDDF